MAKDQITQIHGFATFVGPKTVKVGNNEFTAKHILIATGSQAFVPDIPGSQEHGIELKY